MVRNLVNEKLSKNIYICCTHSFATLPWFSFKKEQACLRLGHLTLDFEEGQIVKL
jgi:hypothetical protein